jgi:hypothetical protein
MDGMDPQRRERVRELGELIASVTPDELLLADDEAFSAFCQALEHSSITETAEFVVFDWLPVAESED